MSASIESLCETHRLDQLPAFPAVLLSLLRACQEAEPDSRNVESLVSQDSAMSVRVLAVASSPVFARGDAPRDLAEAVRVLGISTVHSIGITSGVYQFFHQLDGQELPWLRTFWEHSLGAAMEARHLARESRLAAVDEAYLAGLLHDIGQPLLAVMHRGTMQRIMSDSADSAQDAREREHSELGISHDVLGAAMVDRWSLPGFLADAIRYHHEPVEALADAHPLVRIVHVANLLAHSGAEPKAEAFHAAGQLLDLGRSVTSRLHRSAVDDRESLMQALDLDEGLVRMAEAPRALPALADQVRDRALLGSVQSQLRIHGADEPVDAIARGLALLFGLDRIACFQLSASGSGLDGTMAGRDARDLSGLRAPMDAARSLLARSLLERRPVHTLDPSESASMSVVDRQIAARLGGDGLLCLPLVCQGEAQGVLALGVRHTQTSALLDQSALLLAFAGEAAALVRQARRAEADQRQRDAESDAHREREVRRLRHRLGDPLTIIRNYLHVLKQQVEQGHPGHSGVMSVIDEVERVTELLNTIDSDTGHDEDAGDSVNDLVRGIARLARDAQLVPELLHMDLDLDERLDHAVTAPEALRQLLLSVIRLRGQQGGQGGIRMQTAAGVMFAGSVYNEALVEAADSGLAWTALERDEHFSLARRRIGEQGGTVVGAGVPGRGVRVQVFWPAH